MTIPSHIGQYRIVRRISAGGMGVVLVGEHGLLGRRAAIKTLLPSMATSPELVERFFNEARATSVISDPGVIQIFDFGYHVDGTAYIVMELLEGESLAARIRRRGRLLPLDALRIARQIASSLVAAHACDIIHRDLKPENVFLVADAAVPGGERTKILDFGICKVGTSDAALTQSGSMIGTPIYMAPEQCRGIGRVDHRVDIYAFGCVLFHMLTGRPPFVGDAPGELIAAHLREPAPIASQFVPELPPAVDGLLLRCLAKEPDARFSSMAELAVALAELHGQLEAVHAFGTPPELLSQVRSASDAARGFPAGSVAGETQSIDPRVRFTSGAEPAVPQARWAPAGHDACAEPSRPRRRWLRAVLAWVLVVGPVAGLAWAARWFELDDHHATAGDDLVPEAAPEPTATSPDELPPAPAPGRAAPPADAAALGEDPPDPR